MARSSSGYERIYEAVRRIPFGRVSTYGRIAALAGLPGHARQVGYALHALKSGSGVPWHRVINSQGRISLRTDFGGDLVQRGLLEEEGVEFDHRGRVDLKRYGWPGEEDEDEWITPPAAPRP